MKKRESGIAFLPVLVLLLVAVIAVVYWTVSSNKQTLNNENTTTTTQGALTESFAEVIEPKELKTYLERLQLGTQIVSIELTLQGERLVYKVSLADGKKVTLDAKNGTQVGDILQVTQQATDDTVIDVSNVISIDVARKAAQTAHPDKTIRKIELETEDGILVYSVRFTDGSRVDVHAATGEVVLAKTEGDSSSGPDSDDKSKATEPMKQEGSTSTSSSTETEGVSADQARVAAQKVLPDLTIEKVESETEEGVAVWSVRFTDGSRVDVRKSDGAVVRTDKKS